MSKKMLTNYEWKELTKLGMCQKNKKNQAYVEDRQKPGVQGFPENNLIVDKITRKGNNYLMVEHKQ